MSSSLFGSGPVPGGNPFGPFGNFMNFVNQFNQFRAGFTGDPQQMVNNMIQSGQMSKEQYEQLSGMANQIMPFFRR